MAKRKGPQNISYAVPQLGRAPNLNPPVKVPTLERLIAKVLEKAGAGES